MLTSGQIVGGKYRVESVLGRGGMGVVYSARHTMLGEVVALKVIAPEIAHREVLAKRFVREARAAAQLRSEHVVRVTDVGVEDNGTLYMAMELLSGRDLERVVTEGGPLLEMLAIDYVLQVLVALAEAHGVGMVHRDLKPANLFLTSTPDGRSLVKILDFGISKTADANGDRVTATDAIIGSPTYMSPEQLRGSKALDHRADIWSMGVVLFELLTGRLPFMGDTTGAVFAAVLETAPPPVRSLRHEASEAVDAIVARCLRKDPSARFASVADLADALAPLAPSGFAWADRVRKSLGRSPSATTVSTGASDPLAATAIQTEPSGPMPFVRVQSSGAGSGSGPTPGPGGVTKPVTGPPLVAHQTTAGHSVATRSAAPPASSARAAVLGAIAMLLTCAVVAGGIVLVRRSGSHGGGIVSPPASSSSVPSVPSAAPPEPSASQAPDSLPNATASTPVASAASAAPSGMASARPHPVDTHRKPDLPKPPLDPFPEQRK